MNNNLNNRNQNRGRPNSEIFGYAAAATAGAIVGGAAGNVVGKKRASNASRQNDDKSFIVDPHAKAGVGFVHAAAPITSEAVGFVGDKITKSMDRKKFDKHIRSREGEAAVHVASGLAGFGVGTLLAVAANPPLAVAGLAVTALGGAGGMLAVKNSERLVQQANEAHEREKAQIRGDTCKGAVAVAALGVAAYHFTRPNGHNSQNSNSEPNHDQRAQEADNLDTTTLPPPLLAPAIAMISDKERRELEVFNEPDPSNLSSANRERYYTLKERYNTTRNKDELFDIKFELHDMAKDLDH